MSEFWFNYLSKTLTDKEMVAYQWNPRQDGFTWVGDVETFFGSDAHDYPQTNARFNKMINPQHLPERLTALHSALEETECDDDEPDFIAFYKMRTPDGRIIGVEEYAVLHVSKNSDEPTLYGFLKLRQSITTSQTERSQVKGTADNPENIIAIAGADSMIGNYGRNLLERKIVEYFDTRESGHVSYGYFLAVGIDHMALFNDVLGPRVADEILEKVGLRLTQIVGASATVMRVDGDVYGLLFRRAPHNEMASVAKYILNSFHSAPLTTQKGPVAASVSIGGVTLDHAHKPEAVIAMAETAMQMAKEKGRGCFVSHGEMAHKVIGNRDLLKSADTFVKALKQGRLCFAFQPIMGSQNSDVSFHECLLRLIGEDGRIVAAGDFIPAAEQLGLSRLLDQHVLHMAIDELDMFSDLELSVNVSNLSLKNKDWLRSLVEALRDRPSVAKRLIVEITESAIIEDQKQVKKIVRTLQELGCRVALDDFGAGYTAFSQLKDLNVDLVKIDRSFVQNIAQDHNHLFVQALQSLAQGVDIKTVGEGAETIAEAEILAGDGIDYIQGYVFGLPRTERLWLPEGHRDRRLVTQTEQRVRNSFLQEQAEKDLASWLKENIC